MTVTDPYADTADWEMSIQAPEPSSKSAGPAKGAAFGLANIDDMPVSLLGERTSISQEELETAMEKRPVSLLDALRMVRAERAVPTILPIGDNREKCLFYRGRLNWVAGESGAGKSTIAKAACRDEAEQGRAVLYIDREKDIDDFAATMWDLGDVTDEQASHIFYWNPVHSTAALLPVVLAFMAKYGVDLVVIDSCSMDLTDWRSDYSENNNDNIRAWYKACVAPILRACGTVLVVDHVAKPKQSASGKNVDSESLYAMGATAKRAIVTGVALIMRTATHFSLKEAGHARLIAAKVNRGDFTTGEVVAEFHVTPHEGGRSDFQLRATAVKRDDDHPVVAKRYTGYMERVSALLVQAEAIGETMNGYKVQKHFKEEAATRGTKYSSGYASTALADLVKGGYIELSEPVGGRKTQSYTLLRQYSTLEDPLASDEAKARAAEWAEKHPAPETDAF